MNHDQEISMDQLSSPVFIVGGAYCGKSELAIQALDQRVKTAVIGTADTKESAFQERINQLRELRPVNWEHFEEIDKLPELVIELAKSYNQILLDSVNQWIAHLIVDGSNRYSVKQLESHISFEIRNLSKTISDLTDTRVVLVSSEVGAGLCPPQPLPRLFRQMTSAANQQIASTVNTVLSITAGIPVILRG